MIKRNFIIPILIFFCLMPVNAQEKKQESGLKREVTLYNPYKPSLLEIKKRSFLPDMNDTVKVTPRFHYNVSTEAFMPTYSISPIKAATMLPDPLPKLYKSFVNIGIGNYYSPLAEISITNERSKKGAFGFYGRHYSTNGNVELQNGKKVFAGYMDNDASLFGKRIFKKNVFEGSVDLIQKTRYAYGYDTSILDYFPAKKDIRIGYSNLGAKASLVSSNLDSTSFSYDFRGYYNFFYTAENMYQHNAGISGMMAKSYQGLYVGSGISYDYYRYSDSLSIKPEYIISISPFIKKSSEQWNFKLGFQALIDRLSNPHFYPDIYFGFNVVPSYVRFFASLSGKLEKNEPLKIISENPFLQRSQIPGFVSGGTLFRLPDTDHKMIIAAGLKGNTGIGGNYLVSASYSIINDMLFYSNLVLPDTILPRARGNYFLPVRDNINLFNIHAEMIGPIGDKLSFNFAANLYNYTVAITYPWNKPSWDGKFGLKYNLRNKIIVGMELTGIGERKVVINGDNSSQQADYSSYVIIMPSHYNLNLSAEYRYSKILSFWTKLNNISYDKYYEWAYYPSQRFLFMVGFTYSL